MRRLDSEFARISHEIIRVRGASNSAIQQQIVRLSSSSPNINPIVRRGESATDIYISDPCRLSCQARLMILDITNVAAIHHDTTEQWTIFLATAKTRAIKAA